MGRMSEEAAAIRQRFTLWFMYFRQRFYMAERKNDAQLAKDLGISPGQVSAIVNGDRQVGFDIAVQMRRVFKRTIDEMAFAEPREEPSIPSHPPKKPRT